MNGNYKSRMKNLQLNNQNVATHPKKKTDCLFCEMSLISNFKLERHVRTHTKERPYFCKHCPEEFTREGILRDHLKIHDSNRVPRFPCEVCGRSFFIKSNLTQHVNTHLGQKPFQCIICSSKFARKETLQFHQKIHSKEKPYKCEICEKRFAHSQTLQNHINSHTNEKPFVCQICTKRFTQSGYLKIHLRIHTGEKPYSCNKCPEKFTQRNHLKKHFARKHTSCTNSK